MDEQQATPSVDERVMAALDINISQLNSMYVGTTVGGYSGVQVAAEITERFGLVDDEPMGAQLAERGILDEEAARWLDDVD